MLRYFFCLIFIFFLQGLAPAAAQANRDTTIIPASADTTIPAGIDTTTLVNTDTVSSTNTVVEANNDSLYQPIRDSGYLPTDTIREVTHNQVLAYTLNPDYAYANDPEYWKKQPPSKPGILFNLISSPVFIWIAFWAIVALVLVGIYLIAKENNFSWLYRKGKQTNTEAPESLPEEEADFGKIIRKFQSENNYRMAVRYMYLRLIHTAREKSIVQIRDSSTNAEIARAFGNHPQRDEFRFLATAYDYIFYGGFIPEQELFTRIKNKFEAFQQSISI